MKSLPKPLLIAVACLLLALLALALEMLRFAGTFRLAPSRFSGSCQEVQLPGSSEDIQIDARRGLAYLSLRDRDMAGTVMLLDLNLAGPTARAALTFDPPGFRPRASSLHIEAGTPARLYVISSLDGEPVIEILEQTLDGGFLPRTTLRDPAFTAPRSIAAAPGGIYVINDGAFNAWLRTGEGTLAHHDGTRARVLVDDLAYPTGIALSQDATTLYVAEGLAKAIRVYGVSNGSLVQERTIELHVAPGRLSVDPSGVLWIAAHPKLLRLRAHLRDPGRKAPTLVLRYDPRSERVEEIYADDGSRISAGSIAAPWRERFLIGAPQDEKVLICQQNPGNPP